MANMRSRNLAIMYVHGLGYWVKRRLQGVGSRRGPASSERVSPKGMPQKATNHTEGGPAKVPLPRCGPRTPALFYADRRHAATSASV